MYGTGLSKPHKQPDWDKREMGRRVELGQRRTVWRRCMDGQGDKCRWGVRLLGYMKFTICAVTLLGVCV